MTTKKEEKWQDLCQRAARELDPEKLSELIDQLIQELDARRRTLRASVLEKKRGTDKK